MQEMKLKIFQICRYFTNWISLADF